MRKVNASDLNISFKETKPISFIMETPVGPRFGSEFLPKSIKELQAEAPKKKRLIGVCKYESLVFSKLMLL